MSIAVRKLNKTYGSFTALNDVGLDIPGGELLALLGPSGSGKTTLLRIIAGLETADSGTIGYADEDVTHVAVRDRQVGFVFQHYALFRHMTVFENVAFGMRVRRKPKDAIGKRVRELLHLVRLEGLEQRYPSQLSGGQRQRVALARALAVEPRVLLLDEPFGALDRQLREDLQIEVRALLRRLDITTVFVTHDQDEALSMSDRVAVMNGGRIEQIASPRSLYDTPATKNVAAFIGKGTFLSGKIVKEASSSVVKTSIGDFRLPQNAGQSLPEGEIDYFLRPEAIHLATSNDGLPNRVTGTVAATTFLGDRQQILVNVQDRVRFLVRLEQIQAPAIGDQISLGWNENSSALFREGQRL